MSDTSPPKPVLFRSYYRDWIEVYKKNAVRNVTLRKYLLTLSWVERLAPDQRLSELTRLDYQKLLNDFASEHERQTTMDFHHNIKGAILDAVEEGLLEKDPHPKGHY